MPPPTFELIMAKTVVLERKPLSFSERTYLPQIATGLKTTFSNMFKPKVTLQYPEEKPVIPNNYRGVPTLVISKWQGEVRFLSTL